MNRLWLAPLLVGAVLAAPVKEDESSKIVYAYAVDIAAQTSSSTFSCYRNQNYRTAFIQIYQPSSGGMPNYNGPSNVQNAFSVGLGVEVFVTPQPASSKSGYQQFDEAYSYVTNNGVNLRSIWLQVTSPINWPSNAPSNTNFIYSFLSRAKQYNLGVGIYTNVYDWNQITNGWTGWNSIPGGVSLWYWHVNGAGPDGETQSTFNDFTPFSGFYNPLVKQFGQNIYLGSCGTSVNIDVYKVSNKDAPQAQKTVDGKPVAGLLMESI